jgi:hypothetical protein
MLSPEDFELAKSPAELPSINHGLQKGRYQQVAASRDVTGDNFPNGQIHMRWETSGSRWWVPKKSYIRMRVELTQGDGTPLIATDGVSPNMFLCGNLFQSAEHRIGDRTVCRLGQYVPQVDALKQRISKSKPWLDSVGEVTNMASVDNDTRRSEVCADVAGVGRGKPNLELCWVPPLAIFDCDKAIPASKHELILNPENVSQYQLEAFLTSEAKATGALADNVRFRVTDMYLYAYTIEQKVVSSTTYTLDLEHCHCQQDKIQVASLSQRYFDVSPSTTALAVAYGDARISDTRVSRSKFTVSPDAAPAAYGAGSEQNKLIRFYLSYANQQLPQPDSDPSFTATDDRFAQRYLENLLETGLIENHAGAEQYKEWQDRGLYMLFNFDKSGEDASTRVQVNQEFAAGTEVGNMNVLLFAFSRTSAQIVVSNGQVTDVILRER